MIEQEKAVQFRFDTGAKSHSEKLAEINLPACARVFSCVGLPNIFAWKNVEHSESFQETWLFIPDSALNLILNANTILDRSSEGDIPSAISIQLDNQILYPVHSYGRVSCFVAVPDGKQSAVTPVDLEKLKQMGKSTGQVENSDAVQIAFEFVSRLFDCKQSYSEFAQRLLMFLTDQVDKSHAGLYYKSADSYHRRWSYGGLQLSDKLPVTVSAETVEMWKAANSCGKSFVPGELIQEEPAFVQSPPSFLFVLQIPDFGDCDQWLVMAVPGDISEAAIARMTIITSLLESLSDERVTGYSDLIEMFSGLLGENHKALPIGEALKLCFKLFDGKLRMRSMRQIDADNSVTVCEKDTDEQLRVERSKIAKISDPGRKVIASREPAYCEGPTQSPFDKNNESWAGSVSHVLFPILISDGGTALLEVEFSGNIERARNYHNLFELVSKYLGICISLTKGGDAGLKIVGTPNNEIAETMSLARLQTLSKLNGGYFHELIEHLSVILGQAEIMEYSLKKNNKPLTAENLIQSTDRIVRAAESLARRLEKLKEVSTIRPIESGQSISAELFIKMLPAMTFGYYLTVKDNRNVEIELQTKSDKNLPFSIPVLHIYDFILPLILSLMDEAVCSGKIFVSIAEHFGRPVIRISYPKKLSGKLSLEKLVDKTFNYYQSQRGEKGEFLITAGDAQFIFSACEGDRYQAIYSNTSHHHPVQEYV